MNDKLNKLSKKFISLDRFQEYIPYIIVALLFVLFSSFSNRFYSFDNILTILQQVSVPLIVAMGMTFVILAGSIDLSVGSIVGLGGVLFAGMSIKFGVFAFFIGGLGGLLCGIINGLLFVKAKIPSFITTLATLTIVRGVVYIYSRGISIPINDPALRIFGTQKILGIPLIFIFAFFIFLLCYFIDCNTIFGEHIRAIGSNEQAAKYSSVAVEKTKFLAMALSGFFSGFGGAILASRVGAASPYAGIGMELNIITIVVLGGTVLTGGIGGIKGTILGALAITFLSNGLNVIGVNPEFQYVIRGVILWIAVMLLIDRKKALIIK